MIAPIVLVILGLILAFAGRRFLWLLIGIAGFMLGYTLATFFLPAGFIPLLIGVVVGLIGAFLATRFVKLFLYIAGFVLMGVVLMAIGAIFGLNGLVIQLLLFVVGGVIGLALVKFAFNMSIIVISALGGAAMVMQGLPALLNTEPGPLNLLIGIVVAVAGFVVQWQFLKDG